MTSSQPLSKQSIAIPPGDVRALLSRLPWLSTSHSTKTLFEGFSPAIIDRNMTPLDLPGLTFIGHLKHSLWGIDLFRCESATLRTHWVLVVMDQYTRRIIGFGVHAGVVDGMALCRMFNQAIRGCRSMPKYLSSDHDPLYRFKQWQANLRILDEPRSRRCPMFPCLIRSWSG